MDAVKDYELYVEKYARDRGITKEEAKSHALVRNAKEYYEEESKRGRNYGEID